MELIHKPSRILDLENLGQAKYYVCLIIIFLTLAYSLYFFFDQEAIKRLQLMSEEGVYEILTALSFVLAAAFFIKAFISYRNIFLLLLAIVMVFGAGEEISWGQRVLGFSTPEAIKEINVQGEFNLHNLEIFNGHTFEREEKTGIAKLITINFLYKLFWLGYCVVLPLAFAFLRPISSLAQTLRLPVPPLTIGIFFFINWLVFRVNQSIYMAENEGVGLYRITEVLEACSAFLFMTLGFFFLRNGPTIYIDKSNK